MDLDLNVNPVPFEAFRGRIHPDDLAMVTREIEGTLRSRSPFSQEYRVVHRDGSVLHVLAVGGRYRPLGRPTRRDHVPLRYISSKRPPPGGRGPVGDCLASRRRSYKHQPLMDKLAASERL
ncbi:PAS domain-containing protein [Acuticoccus sediminis]|uniref:PAS domain-containing protein n=1 Tax=Acuticoccus sediminis TaxID=2184697 RepID=UPI001CFF026E